MAVAILMMVTAHTVPEDTAALTLIRKAWFPFIVFLLGIRVCIEEDKIAGIAKNVLIVIGVIAFATYYPHLLNYFANPPSFDSFRNEYIAWKDYFVGMTKSIFVILVVSFALGVLVGRFLLVKISLKVPKMCRLIGILGAFPLAFIFIHIHDDRYMRWYGVGNDVIRLILRFSIVSLMAICLMILYSRFVDPKETGSHYIDCTYGFYKDHIKKFDICFYILFAIIYIRQFYGDTMFNMMFRDETVISFIYDWAVLLMVPLSILAAKDEEDKKLAILKAIIILTGFVYYFRGGDYAIFILCITIVAASGRKLDVILKIALISGSILMIAAYLASMNGYIPYLTYDMGGEMLGHAFGMGYRTDFSAHILYLVMSYAIIRGDKLTLAEYMTFVFDTFVVHRYAQARMNTACLILFLAGYAFLRIYKEIKMETFNIPKWTMWVHIVCMAGIFAVIFVYSKVKKNVESSALNMLGSFYARLMYSLKGFEEYPIRFFGTNLPERGAGGLPDINQEYFWLDVSYVRTILRFGLIILVIYIIIMTIASNKSIQKKQIYLSLGLTIIALASIIEHHATELSYNALIFAVFADISLTKTSNTSIIFKIGCKEKARRMPFWNSIEKKEK